MERIPLWRLGCASLNHCKKMKLQPSCLIPQKLTINLELLVVFHRACCETLARRAYVT